MSGKTLVLVSLGLLIINFLATTDLFARITPNDRYQQTRADFVTNLSKIQDQQKKQLIITADQQLKDTNQLVCARFQIDLDKMAAILEELKSRQNVTKTVVAYGQGSTQLDTAAYYLNYAAEALAYQKIQDYTPNIAASNLAGSITYSSNNLKGNLNVLQNKILRAKQEVKKALNTDEK